MKRIAVCIALGLFVVAAGIAGAAPTGQMVEGEIYVVEGGDTLTAISKDRLGRASLYLEIVEATNSMAAEDESIRLIEDPNLIYVGQKLVIPAGAGEGEMGQAECALTLEALRNAEYSVPDIEGMVKLADGQWEGEPFEEGAASRPQAFFVPEGYACGDLNGDGVQDATAVVAANFGGSGGFFYLEAVLNEDGAPMASANASLGDRVQLKSVAIEDGEIIVDMVTHGPDDPMCCPTQETTARYRLQDGALAQVSDVAGTYTASLPAASSPGREMTFTLNPDGTFRWETDYLAGDPPIVQVGTWEAMGADRVQVTITGQESREYDSQEVIVFELRGDQLAAVEYDQSVYGSEGLALTRE